MKCESFMIFQGSSLAEIPHGIDWKAGPYAMQREWERVREWVEDIYVYTCISNVV